MSSPAQIQSPSQSNSNHYPTQKFWPMKFAICWWLLGWVAHFLFVYFGLINLVLLCLFRKEKKFLSGFAILLLLVSCRFILLFSFTCTLLGILFYAFQLCQQSIITPPPKKRATLEGKAGLGLLQFVSSRLGFGSK